MAKVLRRRRTIRGRVGSRHVCDRGLHQISVVFGIQRRAVYGQTRADFTVNIKLLQDEGS